MTKVQITAQVPTVRGELASNLLSVLGLVVLVVGAGGLAGNWWVSILAAGVVLTVVGALNARAAEAAQAPGGVATAAQAPQQEPPPLDEAAARSAIATLERWLRESPTRGA